MRNIKLLFKTSYLVLLFLFAKSSSAQVYTINTGGTVNTCSGTLYDDGGAGGNYTKGKTYTMTFCSSNSTCLSMDVTQLDIKSADNLSFYDGPTASSTLLIKVTNNNYIKSSPFISTQGCITVKFTSASGTGAQTGFTIGISCVTCAPPPPPPLPSIVVTPSPTVLNIENLLFGPDVKVSNLVINCPTAAYGTFTGTGSNLGLNNGLLLTTGSAKYAEGPNNQPDKTQDNTSPGDACLETYSNGGGTGCVVGGSCSQSLCNSTSTTNGVCTCMGCNTTAQAATSFDACSIEFDVIPTCDSLKINYVFGSEEWPEYTGGNYSDKFAFFISGPGITGTDCGGNMQNIAVVPGKGIPVSIDNISATTNSQYYLNNKNTLAAGTQYDAITKVLTAKAKVIPCSSYHMKVVIADFGDGIYDSGVFLQKGGINCGTPALTVTATNPVECCKNGVYTFTLDQAPTTALTINYTLKGTATNGTDYGPLSGSIVVPAGQTIVTLPVTAACDGIAEGSETIILSVGQTVCTGVLTASSTMTISDPPKANAGADAVMCAAVAGANLNATGGGTYSWSPAGGLSCTTCANPVATPATTTTYTVTVTDANGCTDTDAVVITSSCGPAVTVTSASVCPGACAVLTATGSNGTAPYTFTWNPGGAIGPTFNACSATTIIYTVTVSDNTTATPSTGTGTFTVYPATTLNTTKTDVICVGQTNGTATATGTVGTAPYAYSWNSVPPQTTATATNLAAGTYTVTSADAHGCTKTATATIGQPIPPTADAGPDAVVCPTIAGTNLTGTGGSTYAWSPAAGLSCTSCANPVATPTVTTTYTLTVTDASGCTDTDTVVITSTCGPAVTVTSASVCPGACAVLTATGSNGTGPYTYTWNPGGAIGPTFNACAGNTTTYTVTLSDNTGTTATGNGTLTIYPTTTLTTTKTDVKCIGNTDGTATATGTLGTAPYAYSWGTTPVQTTATATNLAVGTYSVTSTDAHGCTQTATATIGQPAPIVLNTSTVPALCGTPNGSASVNVISGGTGPFTYNWMPGPGTAATFSGLNNGTYSVTVTDVLGCTSSTTAIVNSFGGATVGLKTSTNILCKGGNNGAISISISGGTKPYNIVWSPSGGPDSSATSLIAGTYTVIVKDANNCQQSTIVTLTEPPLLTAAATGNSPLCPGTGSVGVTVGGGVPVYTYSWMPGGATTQNVTGLSGGVYTVTVTDANGCTQVSTAAITVPATLVLTATPVDGSCGNSNGSISLNASGGTPVYAYNWAPAGAGQSATGLAANTYTITMTDSKSCTETTTAIVGNTPPLAIAASVTTNVSCKGGNDGSVTATPGGGTAPLIYTWTPAGGGAAIASGLIAGTYTVNVIDSKGCTAVSSATVTEPPLLTISAPAVPIICIGQSATLIATATGGTVNYTYGWMPGSLIGPSVSVSPVTTTTYSVAVVDSKGCTASSTVLVTIRQPLTVTAGAGKNVCAGSSTTVTATATGGDGAHTYTWQPGNTLGSTISVTPVGTQIYTVTVSDGCGTPVATSVVTVQSVAPILTPAFTPDSSAGCAPLCVTFANITTGGTTTSCNWDFGDAGSSQNCAPTYCYRKSGTYSVKLTVTDTNGCASILTKTNNIKVFPIPVGGFIADPKSTSILTPLINFTDKSTSDVVKWNWNFGDVVNSGSTKKNPTYTYKDTGKYQVQLIVTTAYGCVDTIEDAVIIHGDYMFYVPNAFSPNGDGINDTFFPKGYMLDASCYKMLIFDRWGNLIFSSTDLNLGWDGKANGGAETAQQDVYVWKIETCDYQKTKYKYIGHVSLVK
jgi:gliding motility-associated-like protein